MDPKNGITALSRSAPVVVFRSPSTDLGGLNHLLDRLGIRWRAVMLDPIDAPMRERFTELCHHTGATTLPQVFADGHFIGGIETSLEHFTPETAIPPGGTPRLSVTATAATYAGLLPFVGLAAWMWLRTAEPAARVLAIYAALIIGFAAAVHWGRGIAGQTGSRIYLWALLPVLIAWILASLPVMIGLPLLALGLAGEWYAERRWFATGLPGWYRALRAQLSIIAAVAVIAGWISLLIHG